MKKGKAIVGVILTILLILTGCGSETENTDSTSLNAELNTEVEEITPEKAIIKLYSRTGEIFEEKCESRILLYIKSGIVKSVGIDCENEYTIFDYYGGNIDALKIKGKASLIDNCGGSSEIPSMCMDNAQYTMQLSSDSTTLKYNEMDYSISKLKYTFTTKGLKLYETPSFSSKIIEEIKSDNAKIDLIEVGNLEKKGNEWNVWYKVKSATNDGWCFGNLNF
ncbi:MAG: hypothetical protein M9916_05850 [Crocinitomicaceae bacterium]|nr:hypothetical protein [Crocinitomicaceae bacterium]